MSSAIAASNKNQRISAKGLDLEMPIAILWHDSYHLSDVCDILQVNAADWNPGGPRRLDTPPGIPGTETRAGQLILDGGRHELTRRSNHHAAVPALRSSIAERDDPLPGMREVDD